MSEWDSGLARDVLTWAPQEIRAVVEEMRRADRLGPYVYAILDDALTALEDVAPEPEEQE